MELSIQIKKYRTELHLSQEELAEKVYVTRQTISNWENEKSYPDIHSLLLLSSLFNVSLDQLIKGDIEKMKEIISEQEIKKFNYYGSIYTVHLAVLIISAVPLFMWLGTSGGTLSSPSESTVPMRSESPSRLICSSADFSGIGATSQARAFLHIFSFIIKQGR